MYSVSEHKTSPLSLPDVPYFAFIFRSFFPALGFAGISWKCTFFTLYIKFHWNSSFHRLCENPGHFIWWRISKCPCFSLPLVENFRKLNFVGALFHVWLVQIPVVFSGSAIHPEMIAAPTVIISLCRDPVPLHTALGGNML